jgi:hypothetical protein
MISLFAEIFKDFAIQPVHVECIMASDAVLTHTTHYLQHSVSTGGVQCRGDHPRPVNRAQLCGLRGTSCCRPWSPPLPPRGIEHRRSSESERS